MGWILGRYVVTTRHNTVSCEQSGRPRVLLTHLPQSRAGDLSFALEWGFFSLCLTISTKCPYSWWQAVHKRRLSRNLFLSRILLGSYGQWLTLILLTWRIWWAPNNASRWQMEFNSAFKGLKRQVLRFPRGRLPTRTYRGACFIRSRKQIHRWEVWKVYT
jgi:hypothetical protein